MEPDPYTVLGVKLNDDFEIIRALEDLVRTYHPDRMIARGLPEEAINLAEKELFRSIKLMKLLKRFCLVNSRLRLNSIFHINFNFEIFGLKSAAKERYRASDFPK